jgi:ABC-type uncharacterized transport system substrate-binding protein
MINGRKEHSMGDVKRILAMAVGPQKNVLFRSRNGLSEVRPYIEGLIAGLAKHNREIGRDFEIDYRERDVETLTGKQGVGDAFKPGDGSKNDVIFSMSTTVARAAQGIAKDTPIVAIVSDLKAEGLSRASNIAAFSGRRSQSAADCLERFLGTVPTLKRVRVLHRPGYGPSERALKLVRAVAKKRGIAVAPVAVKSRAELEAKLGAMPKRDVVKPADIGVLVSPVDLFFSSAEAIIKLTQDAKKIPTFFFVPDWVKTKGPSALGAYGVSQRKCGEHMAELVEKILWQGAKPKSLKYTEAGDDAFEWVVNADVAKALNIKIARVI